MARYATESRACLNQPALTQPVRVFGVMMIMYKVGTPFLLELNNVVCEIFLDQAMRRWSGRAIGLFRPGIR